jgi:hypothetical protein
VKIVLGAVIGGAIGFTIAYFSKCALPGVCPLISNPLLYTVIFALFGVILAMRKK